MTERVWLTLAEAGSRPVSVVGGKARALGRIIDAGLGVPDGVVLTTSAYDAFTAHRGLGVRIARAVERKAAADMRWEELWDAATRIRAEVMAAELPAELLARLLEALAPLESVAVAVRSSSPHEDAADRSFAGLHDSVVGVSGTDEILTAVREVWASLWSDRAMLYRRETGQGIGSSMAVVIQRMASSERAGVAFTRSPLDPAVGVIEAVWGLGEGLVSGQVQPDRWEVDRSSDAVRAHHLPEARAERLAVRGGVLELVSNDPAIGPPLDQVQVAAVWLLARSAERAMGAAQDTEWAWDVDAPVLTQARPITTGLPDDERAGYLELTPSVETLERLASKVRSVRLPEILDAARRLNALDLGVMEDAELALAATRAARAVGESHRLYREEFIPLAHGARLFGRVYDDIVRPDDPFEFTTLLIRGAEGHARHAALVEALGIPWTAPVVDTATLGGRTAGFLRAADSVGAGDLARRALGVGRASWELRDDDNLYIDVLERAARRLLEEAERRLTRRGAPALSDASASLEAALGESLSSTRPGAATLAPGERPRQLVGQPAGPGIATGPARVLVEAGGAAAIEPCDVLVVDSLEPATAAYASRAAAIVERRGGMLVHGAIVAREFGLPCVTGVPGATSVIGTGEIVTVDGYLGIVTLRDV